MRVAHRFRSIQLVSHTSHSHPHLTITSAESLFADISPRPIPRYRTGLYPVTSPKLANTSWKAEYVAGGTCATKTRDLGDYQ